MTDGAETPPETPPEPTAPPADPVAAKLAELEKGLKDLAEIGKTAYDDLVARIAALEGQSLMAAKPPLPPGPPADLPGRGTDKVATEKPARA